jgi:ubiquinone/menaquinone biosynthesis C-methylase UbiE
MIKETKWDDSQKAEIAFWERGKQNCVYFSRQFWEHEIENYLGYIKFEDFESKSVLEIGCGPRGMIHYIDAEYKVGIDPLIQEYEKLGILEDGNVKHVTGVGEKLDFADETFDIIICFNVLDHSQIPSKACSEMYRVLKRNGRIIFHSHCITPLIKPFRLFLQYVDKPHPWHFTARELKKMFMDIGSKQIFVRITRFHWGARNPIRQLVAKAIIRNYFAILKK